MGGQNNTARQMRNFGLQWKETSISACPTWIHPNSNHVYFDTWFKLNNSIWTSKIQWSYSPKIWLR